MIDTSHLHPMIVHFPIALIITGFIADILSLFFKKEKCLSKAGFYLMILGAAGALAAWLTGQIFTSEPNQGSIVGVFEKHKIGALVTMTVMLIGAILRIVLVIKKKEESLLKWIVFLLYLIGFISVSITGLMGGTMVYNYMMGI